MCPIHRVEMTEEYAWGFDPAHSIENWVFNKITYLNCPKCNFKSNMRKEGLSVRNIRRRGPANVRRNQR